MFSAEMIEINSDIRGTKMEEEFKWPEVYGCLYRCISINNTNYTCL